MGFPYTFESNFEPGDFSEWTSETDTESRLSVIHYTELARRVPKAAPFKGAYCAMVELSGSGTADAFVVQDSIDIADTISASFRLAIFFADNFGATATDTFTILELQGAANAITVAFGAKVTAAAGTLGTIQLGIGGNDGTPAAVPDNFAAQEIQRGYWYQVHLAVSIQTGGTGTISMTITREDEPVQGGAAVAVSTITNIAVTRGVLGIQDHLATTTGIFLLDGFTMDDASLPMVERYPEHVEITKTGHVFVGNGKISGLTLLTGGAPDNILKVWDSDRAIQNKKVAELDSVAATETFESAACFHLSRGCFVTLEGTDPRALLHIDRAASYSTPGIRRLGLSV